MAPISQSARSAARSNSRVSWKSSLLPIMALSWIILATTLITPAVAQAGSRHFISPTQSSTWYLGDTVHIRFRKSSQQTSTPSPLRNNGSTSVCFPTIAFALNHTACYYVPHFITTTHHHDNNPPPSHLGSSSCSLWCLDLFSGQLQGGGEKKRRLMRARECSPLHMRCNLFTHPPFSHC